MDSSNRRAQSAGRLLVLLFTGAGLLGLVWLSVSVPVGVLLIAASALALALTQLTVRRRINPSYYAYKRVRRMAKELLGHRQMVMVRLHPDANPVMNPSANRVFVARAGFLRKIIVLELSEQRMKGEYLEIPATVYFLVPLTPAPFVQRALAEVNPPSGIRVVPQGGRFSHVPQSRWSEEDGLVYPKSLELHGLFLLLSFGTAAEPLLCQC